MLYAQEKRALPRVVYGNDTILHSWLPEVLVVGKRRFPTKYYRQQRRLARLEYNVRKVYPYARTAAMKISDIEKKLSNIKTKSDKKEILKKEYKQLMKTFKAPLMRLSITQGRILIRLIYRETNHSSFTHIKEYRGVTNAYFWQSIALLFGHNLKASYDPLGEDAEIEAIVQKIIKEKSNKKNL
jgi:hypothetical protein